MDAGQGSTGKGPTFGVQVPSARIPQVPNNPYASSWVPGGVPILGLCRDNEKENGNYHIILGVILGLHRDKGKMETAILLGAIQGL